MTEDGGLRDERRLAAVGRAGIALGGVPLSMDAIAEVAARLAAAPIGVVSLVDGEWDRLLGLHGIDGVYTMTRRIAVADSLCRHVVETGEAVWIDDTAADPRSADTVVVAYLGIRAFGGVPLYGADNRVIGSVCALDQVPRVWSAAERASLVGIAATTGLLPGVAGVAAELTVNLLDLVPLLEALAEAFVVVDADGAILAWNGAATTMFGWTPSQALGRIFHELLFPDREAVAIRAVLATMTGLPGRRRNGQKQQTLWATTREGRRLPVEATIRTLPGAAGPRICVSMLDVSRQLDAQAEADHHERLLRAVLEGLDTAVFVCDATGRALIGNAALRRMIGAPNAPLDELVRTVRENAFWPDGVPLTLDEYPSAQALTGHTVRDLRFRLALPGRPARTLTADADRLTVDGRLLGVAVSLHEDR